MDLHYSDKIKNQHKLFISAQGELKNFLKILKTKKRMTHCQKLQIINTIEGLGVRIKLGQHLDDK